MAKRASLDDKLAVIRGLRDQETGPGLTSELRKAISDRSNFVVAAAAGIVGDRGMAELAGELAKAFPRFLDDPLKTDKLCRAKLAIVQALDRVEHQDSGVFLHASRHVQMEPVFGGSEDTAAPLRAAALRALARLDEPGLLILLTDALVDPKKEVRIAAAEAIAYQGSPAAALLLRLKTRIGDGDSEVLSECLAGLLSCAPAEGFDLVASFLSFSRESDCEAAMLALGRSRLPEAFEALKSCWQRQPPAGLRETNLLAMAMLRLPVAADFLIELLESVPEATALTVLSALKVQAHDPRLRERIAGVVSARRLPSLRARFDRDYPASC
jgi:HEAT repeat protein